MKYRGNCSECEFCQTNSLGDMICANADSIYLSDFVDEKHSCEDFEEK